MPSRLHHGLSRVEILALVLVVLVAVVVIGVLLPPQRRPGLRELRNAAQIGAIHEGMVVFGREYGDGMLPVPGLLRREPDPVLGERRPGVGPEDEALNTTANLYALLIMQNYVTPEIVVSPLERNPVVVVDDDYDWTLWAPLTATYWDPGFAADLASGSNASYGHLPMANLPKRLRWRVDAGREVAIVGSRGPADGVAGSGSLSCAEDGAWRGAMAFGDGHVEFRRAERGRPIRFEALDASCNPFAPDGGAIAFTRSIAPDGAAILQHD